MTTIITINNYCEEDGIKQSESRINEKKITG